MIPKASDQPATGTVGLDPIESASPEELRALQLERLRWSLAHAYAGNPRYRSKFEAARVHSADLRLLEDLARFPFTQKAELRAAYPFDFFAVTQERLVIGISVRVEVAATGSLARSQGKAKRVVDLRAGGAV